MNKRTKNILIILLFAFALFIVITPTAFADEIDYSNLCADEGIGRAMSIIGTLLVILRWIVPLIIIVLGMIDFGKAAVSSDEKNLSKAASSLMRRLVAGLIVFFVPTLIWAMLDIIKVTGGLEESDRFVQCTNCLRNPNSCR